MSAADSLFPVQVPASRGVGLTTLRSERSIALIRLVVIAAVAAIYVNSLGIRRALGPTAILVLTLAALYGVTSLMVLAGDQLPSYRLRFVTLVIDILLITLWVQSTGGARSEFWTLYLIVVVSAALRFRLAETLGVSLGLTILHVAATFPSGIAKSQLIYRPTVMLATGFAVGLLSYQRAEHRRERHSLELLAESREAELGEERAEVERLRKVDLKRSEFVAIAAHEFRTPLAAIIGVMSTLKAHGTAIQADVREELIDGASSQAERLARLVEDLLTVSRIDDGVLRLHLESVDIRELVNDAERASGTTGRVDLRMHRVDRVVCDADAVVRVLTNLLDNAKKYSPEDSRIAVEITRDEMAIRFEVRDAGSGIGLKDREAVFQRFHRLSGTGKPGAGLGLYICRGLIEVQGGTIEADEAAEGGAALRFTLPRRAVAAGDGRGAAVSGIAAASATRL